MLLLRHHRAADAPAKGVRGAAEGHQGAADARAGVRGGRLNEIERPTMPFWARTPCRYVRVRVP